MITRADLDAVEAALAAAISALTARVQALQDKLANGVSVTAADLAAFQQDVADLGNVIPDPAP